MGFFCPGVAGMARSASPDSANSQFFLMTAYRANLNGDYTPFGRVLEGLDVVESLKAGSDAEDGRGHQSGQDAERASGRRHARGRTAQGPACWTPARPAWPRSSRPP